MNQEKLATDEDRARGIDRWVRLFRAKTWEELKMVASGNEYMTSTLESVYLTNEDKNAIKIAREREDYLAMDAYRKKKIAELTETNKKLDGENKELKDTNKQQASTIDEQAGTIEQQAGTIDEQAGTIKEQASTIEELQKRIEELKVELNKKK